MKLNEDTIKEKTARLGCDLCGIASIERFENLSRISSPQNILPEAKSVIVIAKRFLSSAVESKSTIPYTIVRNNLSREIDEITIKLSYFIEDHHGKAIPTGAIEPCNYDNDLSKVVGLISLKNAAYQAGMGVIGKNTLLITPKYGNMVWLGAVITSVELKSDPIITRSLCGKNCRLCIDHCPVGAIDGSQFIDQLKCWNYAFGKENNGEWRIKCFNCRSQCPFSKGFTENFLSVEHR